MLQDLELIIIDEISMISADMLYKVNQRVCEIFISDDYFGGKLVLLVGDLMQLRPIKGRFIFEAPKSRRYLPFHKIDPLWNSFEVVVLETNHRQGEGSKWTEMLNRFRIGEGTDEDKTILEERRMKNFPEMSFDDACHVFYTNAEVDQHNNKILNLNPNRLVQIEALCHYPKGYTPIISEWNTIDDTQFRKVLNIKVKSRVMLVFNINISDSLINGAMGIVTNIVQDQEEIKAIIVNFDNESVGMEQIKTHNAFLSRYSIKSGVPIFRTTLEYSLPLRKKSRKHGCMGKITQFALRLADASTAHKCQGITVAKNSKLVVHGHNRMPKGMSYVMLSRCASINSIYLDEKFDFEKICCIPEALEENENLNERSIVKRVSEECYDLLMLNVNRLKPHIEDLENYLYSIQSRMIAVVETWIDPYEEETIQSSLGNFTGASIGNGKGVGVFIPSNKAKHLTVIEESFQLLTIPIQNELQAIIVYLSSNCDFNKVIERLQELFSKMSEKPTLLVGDFNFDSNERNLLTKFLKKEDYFQMVTNPTHEKGRSIDHLYVLKDLKQKIIFRLVFPYFTDHAGICIRINNVEL